ncbi:MAG: DedA family protein [Dissulfurispiraceae bacterium]
MNLISTLTNHFPYIGQFILLILGSIGLPIPEDSILVLCGFLISHDIVEPVPAILTVYTGLLISDFLLYAFGKKYGRAIVVHKRFRKVLSSQWLSKLEEMFAKRGVLIVLFGRHLAGLRAQIFLAAGVLRMSSVKFLITDAFSSLFTMALMVGIGYVGGKSLLILRKNITRIEHVVIVFIRQTP